jgi:small-conductance mechanosensitive channel
MGALLGRFRFEELPSLPEWESLLSAIVVLIIGFVILRVSTRMLMKALGRGLRDQSRELVRKTILYVGATVLFVMVLNAAGVSVGALLGAAGVIGIAIGIASQTSLSNIISGLFLVSERFFEIGDILKVGETSGVVVSIDLLSVKIKTFDNILVRIPNQQLIEQNITNVTRFPVRRMDIVVIVAGSVPVSVAIETLRNAATSLGTVLEEPEPLVLFRGFVENGTELLLGVWFERANYVAVRNAMAQAIQTLFHERGLPIRTRSIVVQEDSSRERLSGG